MTGRICVFGAGRIGCHIGGRLAGAAGADVTLIGRAALARELAEAPLRVTDCDGADIVCADGRPKLATDPEALAGADLVLVTVKSGATAEAADAIRRHAPSRATVVSLQNGVDNVERLRAHLPGVRVLAGMVPFNVTRPEPGCFHRGTAGRITVEDDRTIAPWLGLFVASGLPLVLRRDMQSIAWGKLVINLNNAVNALSGLTLADELADRAYRRVWSRAMREALALLRAVRIRPAAFNGQTPALVARALLLPDPAWAFVARLSGSRIDPLARSSMADDLREARPTEVGHINGAVVALAQRLGREAPVNAALMRLIHDAEAGAPPIFGPDLAKAVGV